MNLWLRFREASEWKCSLLCVTWSPVGAGTLPGSAGLRALGGLAPPRALLQCLPQGLPCLVAAASPPKPGKDPAPLSPTSTPPAVQPGQEAQVGSLLGWENR